MVAEIGNIGYFRKKGVCVVKCAIHRFAFPLSSRQPNSQIKYYYFRMVFQTSDSCNTLVSLDDGYKVKSQVPNCSYWTPESYEKTEIHLDVHDYCDRVSKEPIHLPLDGRVDYYLKGLPGVRESCDELLANPARFIDASSTERVLYVAQGEIAHATARQCDLLVSDKVTTCHLLALRSETYQGVPLTSLTHIDSSKYEDCIWSMVEEHLLHHRIVAEEEKCEPYLIELDIHVVGGYEDRESCNISNWLMKLLANIAREYKDELKFNLKTCAISSLNDDGYSSPIARGLSIDTRSGEIALAKVADDVAGPARDLRSVRLWSELPTLSVIHTAASNELRIDAFSFAPFPELEQLLSLPDHMMLQCTSSSPNVEELGFCDAIRSSLRFLLETPCTQIFGSGMDRPLTFQRYGNSNSWKPTVISS